ncbi:MAG: ATP-dependent sacrificial sulfur transferase LarE [Myxococcota bacterium]
MTETQISARCAASQHKLDAVRAAMRAHGSALVAFSGGVDSAFVLKIARDELGAQAVALTAVSPSVAPEEVREAKQLADKLGVRHVLVDSHELKNPSYAANPQNRCYFCKSELYDIAEGKRQELGLAVVLDGYNADDEKDHRPGHQAAQEHRVRSPLAENGLTKEEIRAWSHRMALPTWDKPQLACLASRIPYGTAVTAERLVQIGSAESDLKALGLRVFRVRYHGDLARLEVGAEEQRRFDDPSFRQAVNDALRRRGFSFVALDLEPFRSGRMNEAVGPLLKPFASG